ncbi:hypothetical protein STANM309S_02659 [Streptomyces tanashiensis]
MISRVTGRWPATRRKRTAARVSSRSSPESSPPCRSIALIRSSPGDSARARISFPRYRDSAWPALSVTVLASPYSAIQPYR